MTQSTSAMSEKDRAEPYTEIPAPQMLDQYGFPMEVGVKAYVKGGLHIIIGQQVIGGHILGGGKLRWHLSISHANRYPVWNEIRDARYALLPDDCTMAMLLPPRAQYVNLHPNCFHLHEIVDQ
jgi:hypothetical protein